MPTDDPTDRQVRAQIYKIVRVYLEIERGLRPPDQLEKYLTPAEYRRHRRCPQPPASRPREAVLPTDVGRIRLDRHLPVRSPPPSPPARSASTGARSCSTSPRATPAAGASTSLNGSLAPPSPATPISNRTNGRTSTP
jgi:hypothetical protein